MNFEEVEYTTIKKIDKRTYFVNILNDQNVFNTQNVYRKKVMKV